MRWRAFAVLAVWGSVALATDGDGAAGTASTAPEGSDVATHGTPDARVIARSAPNAGNVTATVPERPPTAAAVPNPPATGPQLAPAGSTTARLENAPPTRPRPGQSPHATEDRLPSAPDAVLGTIANPLARAGPPPGGPLQACIDGELSRRGLNAYGDPPATRYPAGLPVPEDSIRRYSYVLGRSPSIASACAAATPFR